MKAFILFFLITFIIAFTFFTVILTHKQKPWNVQSIDTMKYSRDLAREKLHDPSFNTVINTQMAQIARTGANFVAIDTPYDDEFLPILKRWVSAARKNNLHVWFRGNFSGWEQWFGYDKMDKQTHMEKTQRFILNNSDLFQNGDIFTSCPECENGSNPRLSNPADIASHREFLIKEYAGTKSGFRQIGKNVASNYYSMNESLAAVLMDKETTSSLDGIVVIDHYVKSPTQLAADIRYISENSGGRVVLGEFGAPIPDIHGAMTDDEQSVWLSQVLENLSGIPELIGINYWVNTGGSTALWDPSGQAKPAVAILTSYYSGNVFIHPLSVQLPK